MPAIVFFFVVLIPVYVFGHYYKKAVVVSVDSSRLAGYVEKISESELSCNVRFKNAPGDTGLRTIPVSTIAYVLFADDSSEFHRVQYTPTKKNREKIVEYRLAKKMLGGYADLYKLQLPPNEIKPVYERYNTYAYVVKIDTAYYTMDMQEKLDGTTYTIRKGYVGVLKRLLKNEPSRPKNIERVKFRDARILPLFDNLNRDHPEIQRKVYLKKERRAYYHGVCANGGIATVSRNLFFNVFELAYTIKIHRPELNRKVYLETGISIGALLYKGKTEHTDKDTLYSGIELKLPIQTLYYFTNTRVAPFIGGGGTISLSHFPVFYLKETIGCTIDKRFTIAVTMEQLRLVDYRLYLNLGFTFNPPRN